MQTISHMEDKNFLAHCVVQRSYELISNYIDKNIESFDFSIIKMNKILAYKIQKIDELSEIFEDNYFVVKFFFENFTHDFNDIDDKLIGKLIASLSNDLKKRKGYFIIKVPSSNPMLINQLNKSNLKYIFAGGTVCYLSNKIIEKQFEKDKLQIRIATREDKVKFKHELLSLGKRAFENYFGQYHISYITRERAPLIYERWIENYLNKEDSLIITPFFEGNICGFLALDETEFSLEIVLNCVDEKYRGLKIYERMVRNALIETLNRNKLSTISTQFDNYPVQRAWVNVGYKPYYSFYLFHFNNL